MNDSLITTQVQKKFEEEAKEPEEEAKEPEEDTKEPEPSHTIKAAGGATMSAPSYEAPPRFN